MRKWLKIMLVLSFVIDVGPCFADTRRGLLAYWKFDEGSGTTANDVSGFGVVGTLTSGVAWATGCRLNNCLSFDGSVQYVNFASLSALSGPITLSAWVKTSSGGAVFTSRDPASGVPGAYLGVRKGTEGWACADTSGKICFGIDGNGVYLGYQSSITVTDNAWHLITGTATDINDYTTFKIYIDGADATGSSVTVGGGTITASGMRIGYSSNWTTTFTGLIDDARIYSRALVAADVSQLYTTGKFVFNKGKMGKMRMNF